VVGPDPAVAATRLAVRRVLAGAADPDGQRVLVACSGGADSLALLAAAVFEARGRPWSVVGVTVDHGLHEDSAEVAERVVAQMAILGADETATARVAVTTDGHGPEAAAREARYAVLEELAQRFDSGVVLLGHTLDDQAETVLLGLARGSGGRSLAGMRRAWGVFRRPLLDLTRAETEAACRAEGIAWWTDPANDDPRFTRNRVRHTVLPMLEAELGPGVAATLARTADQVRPDIEALDGWALRVFDEVRVDDGLDATALGRQPSAVISRVLRLAALAAGSPPADLFHVHVVALADLVAVPRSGSGHGDVQLPGRVTAYREGDLLRFRST